LNGYKYIKNEEKYYKDQKENTVKKFHILLTIVWHIVSCEGYGVILYRGNNANNTNNYIDIIIIKETKENKIKKTIICNL